MHKKFSLILAALLLSLTLNASAWAQDNEDGDDTLDIVLQQDGDDVDEDGIDSSFFFGHGRRWGGRGHGPAMRGGRPCQGMGCAAMSGGRQGMAPGMGRGGQQHHGMRGRGTDRGMGMGGGMARGGFGGGMMRNIDLSDAQKAQLLDIMTDSFRQRAQIRMETQDLRKKLYNEYQSETPNRDIIMNLNKALGELNGKSAVLRQENQEKFQNILTAEQRDQLNKAKDDFEKMRNEFGPRQGPRPQKAPRGPRM